MSEKITVLIASVKEREEQLKIVLDRIWHQHGEHKVTVQLVLNFYVEVPGWLAQFDFVVPHLNPNNTKAHDAIWQYMPIDGYVFVCDDDLWYPLDYFDKFIKALCRHEHKVVCTAHGSNIQLPAKDYMESRQTWGFTDEMKRDIFVSLCGVGVCAFHTDTLKPKTSDFPIQFMRDLFFSTLCLKEGVKVVNIQRDAEWIMPLQTTGMSVYEATVNNAGLRDLKNEVFKDRFLPALHKQVNGFNDQYVLIQQTGDFDERLLSKALTTLVDVSTKCNIIVFSDKQKDFSFYDENYSATVKRPVLTRHVTPDEMAIGRMGCKVYTMYNLIRQLPDGAQVLMSDADVYFLRDPFSAFEKDFDLGVTTRCEPYHYPLNAGIIFMRVSGKLKEFLSFVCEQLFNPTWPELLAYQKRVGHDPKDLSWNWDQDMICTAYLMRDRIKEQFGIDLVDVGPYWNWAPHCDGSAEQIAKGKAKLMRAYHNENAGVLHLKSQLKSLLFEGLLP